MAIRRTTVHPVVGTVEWETDKLESGHAIRLLNNFEKNIGLVLVPQLVGINDVRTDALQNAGAKFNGKLKFFKPAHGQLLAAFAEIEKAGLKAGEEDALKVGSVYFKAPLLDSIWK